MVKKIIVFAAPLVDDESDEKWIIFLCYTVFAALMAINIVGFGVKFVSTAAIIAIELALSPMTKDAWSGYLSKWAFESKLNVAP